VLARSLKELFTQSSKSRIPVAIQLDSSNLAVVLTRRSFFSERVVNRSNSLTQERVDVGTVNTVKDTF